MSLNKKRPHEVIPSYLDSVSNQVATITNPCTDMPLKIPHFSVMRQAAENLDKTSYPADIASVITSFLQRGSCFDMQAIPSGYQMEFPADHHIHPDIGGMEFYILAANLDTTDPDGRPQKIGIAMWMQKNRMVGLSAQKSAGWSDGDTLVGSVMATAVLAPPKKKKKMPFLASTYAKSSVKGGPEQSSRAGEDLVFECEKSLEGKKVRRSRLLEWPIVGGKLEYSKTGEPFIFSVGPDSFSGTENVLPLQAQVNDGENLTFDLMVDCLEELQPETAFFLQGPAGPTGFQVNWPQLKISGSLMVEGKRYQITAGTGTIVHQAMPTSLENADGAVNPIPYLEDPRPFVGWAWQWFNFDNKDAAIFAGVNINNFSINLVPPFGVYATIDDGKWKVTSFPTASTPQGSSIMLGDFHVNPTVASQPGPDRPSAIMPTTWKYLILGDNSQPLLDGFASAWAGDGAININDWSMFSELPVTYYSSDPNLPDGVGYCESFGFESTIQYTDRGLQMLRTGQVPEPSSDSKSFLERLLSIFRF
ncbi:hypothetical protein SPB21_32715 [Leptothoe sp. ISB3NOV94-8A]